MRYPLNNVDQTGDGMVSTQLDALYQQIQTLSVRERLELISRLFADLKANVELQEELAIWDRLSDEALDRFEQHL
jgi:hypothetical protein